MCVSSMPRMISMTILAVLILPGVAGAQIENGDFESGGSAWSPWGPPGWEISFPPIGGNPDGYAYVKYQGNAGRGGVNQTVTLLGDRDCRISFQYRFLGGHHASGRVILRVDSEDQFVGPWTSWYSPMNWETVYVEVPCGTHTLNLVLATTGNDYYTVGFDNVVLNPIVPVEASTWGSIKARYGN